MNHELRENVISTMQRSLQSQIGDNITKAFTMEIRKQLVPMLDGKLDTLQKQVHCEFTQKLNDFDSLICENITQACKNKVNLKLSKSED